MVQRCRFAAVTAGDCSRAGAISGSLAFMARHGDGGENDEFWSQRAIAKKLSRNSTSWSLTSILSCLASRGDSALINLMKAILALEDGTVFHGQGFGAK